MKVWYGIIDSTGQVTANGLASGEGRVVVKQLFSVLHCGSIHSAVVADFYEEHGLDQMTTREVIEWVKEQGGDDDDLRVLDALGLFAVTDELIEYLDEFAAFLATSQPGEELIEEAEDQTTIFVKVE